MRILIKTLVFFALLVPLDPGIGSAQSSDDAWQRVRIKAMEYQFTPDRITIEAHRPLWIEVVNLGNEPHRFKSSMFRDLMIEIEVGESSVRGKNIERVDVEPKGTAIIKILDPPAGEFDYQCRIPSHHGMDGILISSERK